LPNEEQERLASTICDACSEGHTFTCERYLHRDDDLCNCPECWHDEKKEETSTSEQYCDDCHRPFNELDQDDHINHNTRNVELQISNTKCDPSKCPDCDIPIEKDGLHIHPIANTIYKNAEVVKKAYLPQCESCKQKDKQIARLQIRIERYRARLEDE
jgi:Zn finger protein HypA/HybF involved in hydrogenase expression